MGQAAFKTSPLSHVTQLSRGWHEQDGITARRLAVIYAMRSPSFFEQGHNPFLKPGILAAHDCLRQLVDDGVFPVSTDSSRQRRGRIHAICHLLTKIRGKLTYARL